MTSEKMQKEGRVIKVAGPLVVATDLPHAKIYEVVYVAKERLVGEVIELRGERVFIQVYEETDGIGPGAPVFPTGEALQVELGPGLLNSIYDGIQRPLDKIAEKAGVFITRGIHVPSLSRTRKWPFEPKVKKDEAVVAGDIIGTVQETSLIEHRVLVPPFIKKATVESVAAGEFTVEDQIAVLKDEAGATHELRMMHRWAIRNPRPVSQKLIPNEPLITGTRVIDTLFPVAKGGTASIPGPFGAGKTVVQSQLSKWSDADVIIYVGCGERGNEMTDVLEEFPHLKDPKTGKPLMERTILVANTSNMPVAAREASIYTGITIAEYFRDMGHHVALMADSTSRWAEALREISARLEEMPGEEGYPAYLASKVAAFYERAGAVKALGREGRAATLTVVGAVSPPGGDLSEPVTQSTLRVTKVFWALDDKLANRRHFPAINWLESYSRYTDEIRAYQDKIVGPDFANNRELAVQILQREAALAEIVRLVGVEALSDEEQMVLETAKSIREDFLHQNAFDEIDTYTSLKKQSLMLKVILGFHEAGLRAISAGKNMTDIRNALVKPALAKMKFTPESSLEELENLINKVIQIV